MKYPCLVLDHDDTLVNSSATIHYPSFIAFLKKARPEMGEKYSFEDYILRNFDPGYYPFCREELRYTDGEMAEEYEFWKQFVKERVPQAYPGWREILEEHKRQGGIITVVSHSLSENIYRDYEKNGLPKPDAVYGWELPPEHRKPNTWPLEQVMTRFSLTPEELIMVDDLKPGYDMAAAAGVDFAAAGWAYNVPEIEAFMRKNVKTYCKTINELREYLDE